MVILLHYRWFFVKGNIFISEWGIFGVEIFLRYSRIFVKGNFVIGRVECICTGGSHLSHTAVKLDSHLAQVFCII